MKGEVMMMSRKGLAAVSIAVVGMVVVVGTIAIAEPSKEAGAPGHPEMKLPPGWTEDDMKACMIAATPGKMHEHLAKGVGKWHAKTTMWMSPDAEPMKSEGKFVGTPIMDGRFIQMEMSGEMPGMGPYSGLGIYGFDNVSQQFVSSWIDNHGTGIANGVGKLSPDGKTLRWEFTYNCPVTKKPTVLREIETITGENTRTLDMYGSEPKSGKEFKMMTIELTRKPGDTRTEK
jgi:hypothetical protein